MKLPFSLPAPGLGITVLAGVIVVLAAVWTLFDWNWFRRPLERYLADKSGREVRIQDLHVTLGPGLRPTVRLRGVHIENAPWGLAQPMAVVGEAQFTFTLESLWRHYRIVTRLVLKDANVLLERQPNGLRNWRLVHPERTGPGRIRILTLEAHRSQIRFVHRGIDLDFTAVERPAEPPASAPREEPALTSRITFKGTHQGTAFSGTAMTGALLSFWYSDVAFPVRGHIAAGTTRFDIDGSVADVLRLSAMDAAVRIAGPSLSKLHPFVTFRPPVSRPFEAQGRVTYSDSEYGVTGLRGRIGGTQLSGEATYNRSTERPLLKASLRSDEADIADLASLFNLGDSSRGKAPVIENAARAPEATAGRKADSGGAAPGEISAGPETGFGRFKEIDAHVTIDARKVKAAEIPTLESLRLTAALNAGFLRLDPLELGIAGGRMAGTLDLDGQGDEPGARLTLKARDVHLEQLLPGVFAKSRAILPARARLKLASRGRSIAAILGNSTGSAVAVVDNGSISNLADARLALNRMKVLGLLIRGDRDIAVNCAAIAFDFHNGKGTSRIVVLDTEESRSAGAGTIDLRSRQIDLLLTPEPKKPALFAQRKSIRMRGSLDGPELLLVDRVAVDTGKTAEIEELLRTTADSGEHSTGCAQALAPIAAASRR